MANSPGPFCLTLPADGGQSTKWVTTRFLKKLARDFFSLPAGLYGEDLQDVVECTSRLLRSMGKDAVLKVLRRPQLHVFLCCALSAMREQGLPLARVRARQLLFQLLFELSVEGRLESEIVWDAALPSRRLVSPTHRLVMTIPEDAESIVFGKGCRAIGGDIVESPDDFPGVGTRFVLSLEDSNPMSDFEAHPDKEGNQISLGSAEVSDWVSSISDALKIINEHLPGIHREMEMVLQQFIPVGTDDEKHLSASYQESIGTAYLTLHPQLMTMVEAIIHEFQHNKINMLFQLEPVMENAFSPLYSSPVRPDPRPLHGVMLAAHAFVPVAELYRRLRASGSPLSRRGGFGERFRKIVNNNTAAIDVLVENARPTRLGQAIIDEMVGLNREHQLSLEGV